MAKHRSSALSRTTAKSVLLRAADVHQSQHMPREANADPACDDVSSGLCYHTLAQHCVSGPTLPVDERDALGVPTGEAYQHDLFAKGKRGGLGLQGFSFNLRGGQPYFFQSMAQRRADYHLKMCPYVLEIRCNYPVIDTGRLQGEGRQAIVYADDYAVIHRMLSVELAARRGKVHLHGLCYHRREWQRATVLLRGKDVTLEYFQPRDLPDLEVKNAITCCQWLHRCDLNALRPLAVQFSARLGGSPNTGVLDDTMHELARALKCSDDAAYVLLAASIALGMVWIDPCYELGPRKTLHLLRRRAFA